MHVDLATISDCKQVDSDEEDVEIELVEEEAPFLKGHGRMINDLSPVRIVKNPDGSLAQAAMMQGALSKERREQKMTERQAAEAAASQGGLGQKSWSDPMGDRTGGGAGFDMQAAAQKMGMNAGADIPEWKKHIIGGSRVTKEKSSYCVVIVLQFFLTSCRDLSVARRQCPSWSNGSHCPSTS